MEDKAANYIAVLESEPYEYYDPDDVEFAIENMEGLTDEEKQMMRTLLSISNDFYRLQQEAQQMVSAVRTFSRITEPSRPALAAI